MRTFRLALCFGLLCAVVAGPAVLAQCRDTGIDPKAVERLLGADDVAALDKALNRVGAKDAAMMAVYRTRRLDLNATDEEELRYLRVLPKTKDEVARIEALGMTTDICENPDVARTVYGMFTRAAEIIHKHGKSPRPLLQACILTEGALADTAWPAADWLLQNAPKATLAALRGLPEKDRTAICHGQDPMRLKEKVALEECRSGM